MIQKLETEVEKYGYVLNLNALYLDLKIGVSDLERSTLQNIELYVSFYFKDLPFSCISDNIEQTICYHNLYEKIINFCKDKEFKLIENLTYQLHGFLKQNNQCDAIKLRIFKHNPLKSFKLSSASFEIFE